LVPNTPTSLQITLEADDHHAEDILLQETLKRAKSPIWRAEEQILESRRTLERNNENRLFICKTEKLLNTPLISLPVKFRK
jgi:hypothetical protein